ncbi:hypothetical protein FACS189459_5540 [Bacilli bacterium]|nr:hypothetical protein FACS189459_5540 [Bacilli bacterium]
MFSMLSYGIAELFVSVFYTALLFINLKKNINDVFYISKNTKLPARLPKVLILYPTCDDFIETCALRAMDQDYKNCEFFILDDSKTDKYKNICKDFGKRHNVKVVCRENRVG